jgi:predicted anti-sigma-YlaC factor YlaD
MTRCEQYQTLLLDHLYGLLDPDESLALIEHAGQCDTCRASLQQADNHKKLLGAAAKSEFTAVRFEEPDAARLAQPARRRRAPALAWKGWAIAAGILVALTAIGLPIGKYASGFVGAQNDLKVARVKVDKAVADEKVLIENNLKSVSEAEKKYKQAGLAHQALEKQQEQEVRKAAEAVFAQDLGLTVMGPAALRLDEPTTYTIETRKLDTNALAAAKLDVVLRDETTNKVVFEQKDIRTNGNYSLVLAPEVAIKGGSGLVLELACSSAAGARGELREKLALARATYTTHITTDKPMYQPGETVYFRSLTLDRFTLRPATDDLTLIYTLYGTQGNKIFEYAQAPRLQGPDGKDVLGPDKKPVRGIGTGQWDIPSVQPGGEYTLEVREPRERFPTERRKFVVNQYQKHRLLKEVKFDKESYGPGGEVVANVSVKKAEGGAIPAFMPVSAVVRIDGKVYTATGQALENEDAAKIHAKTDEDGKASIKFKLPTNIAKGEATLGLEFTDGANFEPMSRPIPVVVNRLNLELFAEGGELVAGVPNRVYFTAKTMLDKPAAVKAELRDETGKVVVGGIATLNDPKEPGINQGNGKFAFTPVAGKKYELKVIEPVGIEKTYPLADVKTDAVGLSVLSGVTSEGQAIDTTVYSIGKDRELLVGVYCRGRLLNYQEVLARAGQATQIALKPARDIGGVYRVTVFEKITGANNGLQLKPVAERLVYREPAERLKIAATPEKRVYQPGEHVRLSLQTDTETGKAAPAILLVGVVDKSVIKMADERTARAMPTHFFLTTEVRRPEDLEFTDVLLSDHALAREALDLLMGTQGWRRFLESDPKRFQDSKQQQMFADMKCKADADRLLVSLGKMKVDQNVAMNQFELRHKQIIDKYGPDFENVQAQLALAEDELVALYDGREYDAKRRDLHESANASRLQLGSAVTKLRDFEDFHDHLRSRALLLFGVILLIAGAGSLVIALTRSLPKALPFYGSAVAAVAVCGLVVLGTFLFDSQMPDQASVALGISPQAPKAARMEAPADAAVPAPLGDELAPEANGRPDGFWKDPRRANAAPVAGFGAPPREARREAEDRDQAGAAKNERGGDKPAMKGEPQARPVADAKAGDGKGGGAGEGKGNAMLLLGRMGQQGQPAPVPPMMPGGNGYRAQQQLQRGDDKKAEAKEKDLAAIGGGKMPGAPPPVNAPRPTGAAAPMPGFAGAAMAPGKPGEFQKGQNAGPGRGAMLDGVNRKAAADGEMFNKRDEQMQMAGVDALAQNGMLRQRALQERAIQNNAEALKKVFEQAANQNQADRAKQAQVVNALEKARRNIEQAEMFQAAPCWVRQYAHQRQVGPDPDLRWDFTETVYWHPVVVLPNGKGEVDFQLPDSVTSFQVTVFGHTTEGRLGSFTGSFESKKLFNINGVVPNEVTSNDIIDLPVAVENATDDSRTVSLAVELTGATLLPAGSSSNDRKLALAGNERGRTLFRFQPTIKEGNVVVKIKGHTEPFGSDAVQYTIKVVPEGFPTTDQVSDVLEKAAQHEITLPDQVIKGTLKANLSVFPSPLADLQKGLEGMLREPHGCFEQTSTTNYPNVMILSYMRQNGISNPELEQRVNGLLERGYGRLISYECLNQAKQGREGYEWFGGSAPAHEALTAYGLLQFRDMQRLGFPIDDKMLERTRKWLMSRRDGNGGFNRNSRALDQFGRAPANVTNAYIGWAITESEDKGGTKEELDKEINTLFEQCRDSKDPYFLALVANIALNREMQEPARDLLKKLGTLQKPEGYLDGATTSITGSGGRTLQIESTALALLAWMKYNQPQEYHQNTSLAIKWIGQQRGGHGGFGSTQSTILALRALLVYAKTNTKPAQPGELVLKIGEQEIARRPFDPNQRDTVSIDVPDAEKVLKAGKNAVSIELVTAKQGGVLPYTFRLDYQSLKPVSAEGSPIRMAAKVARTEAKDGETVGMRVTVENTAKKGQGMVVAIVGLPAGLNLPENLEQLRQYTRLRNNGTESGVISAFEVKGRELVLYWRQMAPEQKIDVDIDLICRVPGEYRGPASRAYLYYNADHKHWIDPAVVKVQPKQ